MSIKILPENEIQQLASSYHQPPLLFSNPKNLYQRRAKRLRQLAENHPLADYLLFAAQVTEAQLAVLEQHPLAKDPTLAEIIKSKQSLEKNPLHTKNWKRTEAWRDILLHLLAQLKDKVNEETLTTIEWLEKASAQELEKLANAVFVQDFSTISSDKAVFIWSALSLYWLQLVQQIPHNAKMESGENLHLCPICSAPPTASVIQFGSAQGLRYLHCSLCESEWNMVRTKCTNCEQSGKLEYWSIDNEFAAVRTESCGDCQSYLKVVYQEKDPHVEPIADDLASLFLDVEMEEKGFFRSGLNPFMFPSE